jgi:hypothetical protein
MRRIAPDRRHRASLVLLIGMGLMLAWASTANADYLLFTGATWNSGAVRGVIATPSGAIFDVDAEQLRLITTFIEDTESVVFDLETGDVRLDPDPPSALLASDPFFLPFARELEVQLYTEASGLFDAGPSDLEVDELGALVWAGPITAPPGAGGGGGNPPTDTDGDGVPDSSDNCPGTSNPGQQNNDGDSLGDACDPDDDNDGLSDVLEIGTYATNPFLWDSDGDLISDLDEVNAGSDPNDPNSPGPPAIPALGTVGLILLSLLLMTVGVLRRSGHLPESDRQEGEA